MTEVISIQSQVVHGHRISSNESKELEVDFENQIAARRLSLGPRKRLFDAGPCA